LERTDSHIKNNDMTGYKPNLSLDFFIDQT